MNDSNMTKNIKVSGPNIGCCSALGIAFIVLKLCHVIDWSWWWVLAPFWIPAVLTIGIAVVCVLIMLWANS